MVIRSIEDNAVEKNEELKGKVIRNPRVARRLMDYIDQTPSNILRVIDFKPDKTDPTHQRSVVVFEDNEIFQETFSRVQEENRQNRNTAEDDLRRQMADIQKKLDELTKQNEAKE